MDKDLQQEVLAWAVGVFGEVAKDPKERALRFIEEAIECAQALNIPQNMVERLVGRVYSRKSGEPKEEIAQSFLTLICLAEATGVDAEKQAIHEFTVCRWKEPEFYRERYAKKVEAGLTVHSDSFLDGHKWERS